MDAIDDNAEKLPPVCPSDVEKRPIQGTDGGASLTWLQVIQNVSGGCKPRGIPPVELEALALAMLQLETELAPPVLVADRMILGSIARTLVFEHRMFRLSSDRGVLRSNGDIRPSLPEFRSLAKLKADLLGRLRFRDGKTPKTTLDDFLRGRTAAGTVNAKGAGAGNGIAVVRLHDGTELPLAATAAAPGEAIDTTDEPNVVPAPSSDPGAVK